MSAVWITRDKDGIITAGYVAQHTDSSDLRALAKAGRKPELVDFGAGNGCKIGAPLPPHAVIIDTDQ